MTCNPKINYIHFSAIELGDFFLGFHSCVMKERLVDFNFYKQFFNTPGERAIPLPFKFKNLSFCKWIVKIKF